MYAVFYERDIKVDEQAKGEIHQLQIRDYLSIMDGQQSINRF